MSTTANATGPASAAALYRRAVAQENDEALARLNGEAVLHGLTRHTVVEARLCDCLDNTHPYDPQDDDLAEFRWSVDVDQVEACQVFHAARVHVRYRRRLILTTPEQEVRP